MPYAVDPEYRPMMRFLRELDVADAEKRAQSSGR